MRHSGIILLTFIILLFTLSGCGTTEAPGLSAVEAVGSPESEIHGDLTVVFLKAGAADAAVLMTENATVVIDTGESSDGDKVLQLLADYGRDTIDLMVISHYDKDHVGGAAEILENVTVKRVIGSTSPKDSEEMTAYRAALAAAGLTEESPKQETILLDGVSLTVDPPHSKVYSEDQSNNSSVIVTVSYGETLLLFAGDAMTQRLREFSWKNEAYDLIKIPHHGRDAADTVYYLSSLKSGGNAIVTSSKKEPEDEALVTELESAGITVYLTRNGTVTAVSDGKVLNMLQES